MSTSFQPDSTPRIGDQGREGMIPTADDADTSTASTGDHHHIDLTGFDGNASTREHGADEGEHGQESDDASSHHSTTSTDEQQTDERSADHTDETSAQEDEPDNRFMEPDEDAERRAEEFAREHDPAAHDVDAGEEFRQRGDLIVGDDGQAKAVDGDGHYVDAGDADQLGAPVGGLAAEGGASENAASDDAIEDGGYGVGSARPFASGETPLGHPIKAWNDTRTYAEPGHPHYGAEPHVWFTDEDAAQRAGFGRAGD